MSQNKKKKFDEKEPMMKVAKYMLEKISKGSDIDYKNCSNYRAKEIIGRTFKLPGWLQTATLNDFEELGCIKRNGQEKIELLPV